MGSDRGRIQLVDVVMGFAVLVSFVAVLPLISTAVGMGTAVADPLSSTLLQLALPLFVIAMLVSIGVSARA